MKNFTLINPQNVEVYVVRYKNKYLTSSGKFSKNISTFQSITEAFQAMVSLSNNMKSYRKDLILSKTFI